MPIRVTCKECGKAYALKDSFAGKRIRCPGCKAVLSVPAADASSAAPVSPARKASRSTAVISRDRPGSPGVVAPKPSSRKSEVDVSRDTVMLNAIEGAASAKADPTKKRVVSAMLCPDCGQSMQSNLSICPHCNYNVKLGSRLGLSEAINHVEKMAGNEGDGSLNYRRTQAVDEREARNRKIGRAFYIVVGVLCVILLAFGAVLYHHAYYGPALETLRVDMKLPEPTSAGGFHPFNVGLPVTITLDKEAVAAVDVSGVSGDTRLLATMDLARKAMLPFFKTANPMSPGRSRRARGVCDELSATMSPLLAQPEATKTGTLLVWRLGRGKNTGGFLRGAVLDAGANQAALQKALEVPKRKRNAKMQVEVKGTLGFVITREQDYGSKAFSYGEAVREKINMIRYPLPGAPSAAASFETEEPDERTFFIFHPVILVQSFQEK